MPGNECAAVGTRVEAHSCMAPLKVCVLEDPRVAHRRLGKSLRRSGIVVDAVDEGPRALVERLSRRLPSVALVDVSHPSGDRMEALEELARTFPSIKVVGLVDKNNEAGARRCRTCGAWDCVEKPRGHRQLAHQVHTAHETVDRPLPGGLTQRQREVLRHVGAGEDNLKIAAALGIRERTVKAHITSLYRKLEAQSRVELALLGRILG